MAGEKIASSATLNGKEITQEPGNCPLTLKKEKSNIDVKSLNPVSAEAVQDPKAKNEPIIGQEMKKTSPSEENDVKMKEGLLSFTPRVDEFLREEETALEDLWRPLPTEVESGGQVEETISEDLWQPLPMDEEKVENEATTKVESGGQVESKHSSGWAKVVAFFQNLGRLINDMIIHMKSIFDGSDSKKTKELIHKLSALKEMIDSVEKNPAMFISEQGTMDAMCGIMDGIWNSSNEVPWKKRKFNEQLKELSARMTTLHKLRDRISDLRQSKLVLKEPDWQDNLRNLIKEWQNENKREISALDTTEMPGGTQEGRI